MGADKIKIETPQGDVTRNIGPKKNAGMAAVFLSTNRNKRSVVLDLRTREGRMRYKLSIADVFMHNIAPNSRKARVKLERFTANNPKLIYCSAYGLEQTALEQHPAYDDIIQAASGIASLQTVVSDQPGLFRQSLQTNYVI